MKAGPLDPLMAPALEMERRPVIARRKWAQQLAEQLTGACETVAVELAGEQDAPSQAQLSHLAEAMSVMVISLMAYARGVVPRVASNKPNVNIIVPEGNA